MTKARPRAWMPAFAAVFCLALASASAETIVPDEVFASPQRLVAVEGDRRLNLFCTGEGAPTVLLEAGSGNGMVTWRFVQAEIAEFARVCAYDRAGLGFSDAASRPSDLRAMADDLHRLLRAAGVGLPIVLVAHSLGGESAALYAMLHPDDVAGAVLVEPSFAGVLDAMQAEMPADKRAGITDAMRKVVARKRACLDLAKAGRLDPPDGDAARACIDARGDPDRLDGALERVASRQLAEPKTISAMLSEMAGFVPDDDRPDLDTAELEAAPFAFGDKPLIVLSRGVVEGGPGVPKEALARVEAAWRAGHAALAARSTRGVHIVVPGARHYVQIDRPDAVIDAVRRVVGAVRQGGGAWP